jgi:hypothetical protein
MRLYSSATTPKGRQSVRCVESQVGALTDLRRQAELIFGTWGLTRMKQRGRKSMLVRGRSWAGKLRF